MVAKIKGAKRRGRYTVTRLDVNFLVPRPDVVDQIRTWRKKFLACGPEFSVEFSAPPEFSGGVTEKYLSTGWARTFNLQIRKQIFYHYATAPLCTNSYDIHCVPSWNFPAVSVVIGSRIFRSYLVVTCRDFPAVSAVTGSQIFQPYQVVTCRDFLVLPFLASEGRDFPAVSVVSGRDFPAVAFLAWVI